MITYSYEVIGKEVFSDVRGGHGVVWDRGQTLATTLKINKLQAYSLVSVHGRGIVEKTADTRSPKTAISVRFCQKRFASPFFTVKVNRFAPKFP